MATVAPVNVTTPSDREIVMTRLFDAPRDLVYDCYTKVELLKRWMQPEGWIFIQCDVDLKVGGAFHWRWRHAHGQEIGIHGVYREIVRPQQITRTEFFDFDSMQSESFGTLSLAEQNGQTTLTTRVLYVSQEARDQALTFCVDKEAVSAKLDALLSELRRARSAA